MVQFMCRSVAYLNVVPAGGGPPSPRRIHYHGAVTRLCNNLMTVAKAAQGSVRCHSDYPEIAWSPVVWRVDRSLWRSQGAWVVPQLSGWVLLAGSHGGDSVRVRAPGGFLGTRMEISVKLDDRLQVEIKLGAQGGLGTRIAIRFPLHALSDRSSIAGAGYPRCRQSEQVHCGNQPSIRSTMIAGAMPPAAHMVTRP